MALCFCKAAWRSGWEGSVVIHMKAVCIGSCNIDYTYKVDHFIRPGETDESVELVVGCGGKGLNQSIALAQSGVETFHGGLIGEEGKFLIDKLKSKNVNTSYMRFGEGSTGHAIIQVDQKGQNCILLFGGTNKQFTTDFIDEILADFDPGDLVVLQNEINHIPYIIESAASKGLRVVFNAAPYRDEIRKYPLEKVSWLVVNEVEGAGLAGVEDPDRIMECLRLRYPDTGILLTLGKEGCLYRSETENIRMPACKVQVVDTTAAGDTFIGFFIRGIIQGSKAEESLKLATVASSIAITKPGAADSVPEYQQVIDSDLYKNFDAQTGQDAAM